jgi:trehalose 6-phosphate synthase
VAGRRKLIVVSNRGPVSFARNPHGERIARRGGGGLVTALRSLVSHHEVTWIASAMTHEDRVVAGEAGGAISETARDGSAYRLHLVAHDQIVYDWFYNVISNPTLWFLQHHLWSLTRAPDFDHGMHHAWGEGYVAVNRAFADAVVDELGRQPDAAVFLHDYHLYLAPRFIRERVPDVTLAHFVHIPWPDTDAWYVLPPLLRHDIHQSMLANDVVGVHTDRWRRNFLRACADLVGAEVEDDVVTYAGRRTIVTAHPISVDPSEFDELAGSEGVLAQERSIERTRPEKLIVRVDRTDPSKNVVRGFRAFEIYLDAHPEMHRRVQLLTLLDPSRQDIPEYSEYLAAIQRQARAVNERFQQEGWLPVDLRIDDNFLEAVAAYKQFDVLLVNAIYDGLNLIAKEAPLVNERDGVLVLSENAGVHEELGEWALTVNPFDVAGQAEAIHQALQMDPAERARRSAAIKAHVRTHDLEAWIEALLADLDRVSAAAPSL